MSKENKSITIFLNVPICMFEKKGSVSIPNVVLFVDPDNKALVFVEENTSSVLELNEKQNGFEVVIYVESRDVYFT